MVLRLDPTRFAVFTHADHGSSTWNKRKAAQQADSINDRLVIQQIIQQYGSGNSKQQTSGQGQHRGEAGISARLASGQGRHQHNAGKQQTADSKQQTSGQGWHRGEAGISARLASGQGRHQHNAGKQQTADGEHRPRPVVGYASALETKVSDGSWM